MSRKTALILSVIFALGAVYFAVTYKPGAVKEDKKTVVAGKVSERPKPRPIGNAGTDHQHIALNVFVNGSQLDFFDKKYMLQSPIVHLENDDGINVHKHAIGITLPFFFKTLGMTLTSSCLTLDTGKKYCSDATNKLSFLVNGEEMNPDDYEIIDADKVLVNYGNEDYVTLRLRANGIPKVPDDILKGLSG